MALLQDDGSGRQQWVFTRVAGGYTITMPMGRSGCNQTLTSTTCNSSTNPNLVTFGAPSSSALQLWSIDSVATPAPVAQLIPNGNYYIQSIGRQACTNFTSATNPCSSNINSVDLEAFTSTGLQTWTFTAIGTNLYNIQNTLRSQCYNYLSAIDCSGNFVDQYYQVCITTCPSGLSAISIFAMSKSHVYSQLLECVKKEGRIRGNSGAKVCCWSSSKGEHQAGLHNQCLVSWDPL